ncbi:MAG TPA: V-type ATP synthase subunit I [Clostridia bacterium]|nr:V-type ATP synthase subunit I [Clostridia bacterium]
MIVRMNEITVLGIANQYKALISSLMDIGAVDVSTIDPEDDCAAARNPNVQGELSDIESKLNEVRSALLCLEKYCPQKRGLFQSRREINESEFKKHLENKEQIWESVNRLRKCEERLIRIKSEENSANNLYISLTPWKPSTVPLQSTGTEKTAFTMGTISAATDWDVFMQELLEKAPLAVADRVNSDNDQYYINVFYHRAGEQECLSFLKQHGFNRAGFAGLEGTVADNFERLGKQLEELSKERSSAEECIKSQEASRNSMEELFDALGMERSRLMAAAKVLKTRKVFMIRGWIPERLARGAKEWLESKYTVHIDIREPDEDEEFPVLLENNGLAESVEQVTTMYSFPSSRELDPNAVMAPFFILFFGLMLSDGGYGLVMALLTGFILLRFKLESSMRKMMKLMFFCGISTIFWGAMFGGWFGISFLTRYAVWFDSVAKPELMLSWSLLFGVIHIFAALGMKAANMIHRKQYLDAVLDVGLWYVTFTGFSLFLLPYVPEVDPVWAAPLVNAGKYLLVIGAILLVLTQGRKSKNIFGKLFGGVAKLYDLISFLSDVLSYSRLMALGIATSIIASIVNQMAFMFDFPGFIKPIAVVLILLVGHTVNISINALGAYVHSCRLQFLEFFGKFFEGGGRSFEPFRAETQYIVIKPDTVSR